jgi:hypothetical protein
MDTRPSARIASQFLIISTGFLMAAGPLSAADAPETNSMLPLVKSRVDTATPHPRLFWPATADQSVRAKIKQNPLWRNTWETVQVVADHMLNEPPVVYKKEGRRLLHRSREALTRIIHLSFAMRMTGDRRYCDRAMVEMKAAAAMPDWNPSHFLDTAEMTMALAVGYDWLYPSLTPEARAEIRTAIEQKGLGPYLKPNSKHGWERGGNNWNQVCHAGMVAGALALLEENPDRATEVVCRALAGLPNAMKVYEPDGTYPEGPGYWNYGTTLNVVLLSMLESALGTDFGLANRPGFLKTGDFLLQMTGPTGRYYNFSDCGSGTSFSPAMIWFAARARRPDWLWFEDGLLKTQIADIRKSHGDKQPDRFFPLILVWGDVNPRRAEPSIRNWFGRGPNPLAVFRSSWRDSSAVYLAIKAGSPSASHGHMDVGSFIMEADGVRWSLDLGSQNYHAMESRGLDIWNARQGAERWRIFRYHNRGHSTLMVDDQEQVVRSQAPITEFSGTSARACAVVDLTSTYAGQLDSAIRRFSFQSDHRIVIEDHLKGGTNMVSVRWGMVTPATLKPDGLGRAWLEKDGKRLRLEVVSPAGITLQAWPADPPPAEFDEPNPGVSVIGFTNSLPAGQAVEWKIILTPGSAVKR